MASRFSRRPSNTDLLRRTGRLDAVISTAGRAAFRRLSDIQPAILDALVYSLGLKDKLMGQVNLALAARDVLAPGGSIALTSGTTSDNPILGGSLLSMVNGALEHWVQAAATEMPNGLRLNVVSPRLDEGTPAEAVQAFPGFELVCPRRVGLTCLRCLEGGVSGKIVRV